MRITLWRSSTVRSRYNRMICPQTIHTSSQGASNRSHQQLGGVDGSEIPRWRVARRMAALTMVGTAYIAYTGVCRLSLVHEWISPVDTCGVPMSGTAEIRRKNSRVVEVPPCLCTRLLVAREPKEAQVIDECAVGQHDVDVEPKTLENLHFSDNERVLEVVERVAEIRHGRILELGFALGWGFQGRRQDR